MKENKGKSYVLYIRGVEAFEKYKIPNVELIEIKKFTDKQLVNIAKGDMFPIAKHYNKKLYKMLIKEFGNKTNVCDIWIDSSIANLSFELFDKKQNLHTFKVHTEDSALDFKAFKTKKEIGRGNTAPFIFIDSFTGPGLYSGRRTMCTSQYENIFNAAREFGNRYAEVNGDCSELLNPKVGKEDSSTASKKDVTPMHDPIKIDKYKCTFKFNVGGFTEKDCSLSELADKLGNDKVKEGDNISATIKLAHDELEANLVNAITEIVINDCIGVHSSSILADKVAMILHEVEHYKFQKDFDGDMVNSLSINPRNPEISNGNEIIVGNTYILNGNNDLGRHEDIRLYIGQPVLVLQEQLSGLFLVQYCNGQKIGHIPGDNLSPFCKQDNKKPSEIIVGGKYILNGIHDIGINPEIRPHIGKNVVVTRLHKSGLFSILCAGPEGKTFDDIAKYNLTPIILDDNTVLSKKAKISEVLKTYMFNGVAELKDDSKRVSYTPECSIPLADKEIASKTVEEVSEYLDNTEYDAIINNMKKSISKKYMTEKIAGKHNIILPKDFRERLCDLSYLSDLENRFKQFDNIGILQQELLLKSEDKDMLEGIGELTFAQVLELFTVLADMKGMVKTKDEESGDYYLRHQEKKAELIVNNIKMADITDIKISKMGVLLIRPDVETGSFKEDSRKCRWDLYENIDKAIEALSRYHTSPKVYSLLKYSSETSELFSNVVPEISKKSFGQIFKVLIDIDSLFYIKKANEVDNTSIFECKNIEKKECHNAKITNKEMHSAIEIIEQDIETKINIETYIQKTKTVDIEKQALVDEDEYLKVINFINSNVSAENLSNNIMFYRYDIVVPKDFKERITSLLDSPDYKSKFKFISDPHQCLVGILYLSKSDIDIAHYQLGKLTFEELLELFTILADVSLDAPVELGELNANSQAQDRTKRARPTNMKVEVYPTTTSSEEGEVNPLTNDEVNK